ncbi:MAG: helix-hairpin-helix domain-containing protein [Candidatus Shapirobacteria bacterium]
MKKLTDLPNIGKVTAEKLEKIGIKTPDDFLAHDPYRIFDELLEKVDPTLCRCALAGIIGAHKGKKWNLVMKEAVAKFEKDHPGHKWISC